MNISSIIVMCLSEHEKEVVDIIEECDYARYHMHQNGKIIVTIEGEDTEEEIAKIRKLEGIPNVISASLHYSYCEDELEEERGRLMEDRDVPLWLNNDSTDAKDISYHGNLKI